MAIRKFSDIGQLIGETGKFHYQYVYKQSTPNNLVAANFVDCGQSTGQPKFQPYAGAALVAQPLIGSANDGVYTGPSIPGHAKHLVSWQSMINTGGTPSFAYLLDYLLFYPLIDGDDSDVQVMDNTLSLPRYTDGAGVRLVIVATAPMTTGSLLTVTYTNQAGVSGRVSSYNCFAAQGVGVCATATGPSSLSNTQCTPFWPLADGDTGMRSIESVQFASPNGGFLAFLLVKPIAQKNILESGVPVEKVFGVDNQVPPEIKSGAYLNFLIHRGGVGASVPLYSELIFINSEG